jgi:hypothetical protein
MRDEKYTILVRKAEGKRPHGRPRSRWEDNFRMNLTETEWEDLDWMHMAQDTNQWRSLVNMVMKLRVP